MYSSMSPASGVMQLDANICMFLHYHRIHLLELISMGTNVGLGRKTVLTVLLLIQRPSIEGNATLAAL